MTTQPICDACWSVIYSRAPYRVGDRPESCCMCGLPTRSGIYVRRDPKSVPFPALMSFGECGRCGVPAVVKMNGGPLCMVHFEESLCAVRRTVDELLDQAGGS